MSSHIKLELEITHNGTFTDYLTKNQLIRFQNLLEFGGQKRINNHWYEVDGNSVIKFKDRRFGGASYAFDLQETKK
jgi:hypothetical protein